MRQVTEADGAEPVRVSFPIMQFEIFSIIAVGIALVYRFQGVVIC